MPDTSKLEKLNRELEKSEKKLRKAINDEKAFETAYPKGTDAPALYPWRYAGKFSARAGTPDR